MTAQTLATHYPPELADLVTRKNIIPMGIGTDTRSCPNCGGHGTLMAFRIDGGPFPQPNGRGSKWMNVDGKSGWWKGELLSAFCPVCQDGRLTGYLEETCGLEGDALKVSLEGFRTDGAFAGKAQALADCRSIMAMNREPSGFVTLLGEKEVNHGVGKSHLAMGMVNGFRHIGVWSRYTTLADLLADLKERFGREQAVKIEDLVERLKTIRVLVIDEIDKVELTGWDKQVFSRIIDYRQRNQAELLTILIANAYQEDGRLWVFDYDSFGRVKPHAWPAELGYVQSRILGGIVITVPGPDYRTAQGWAAQQAIRMQQEMQQLLQEEEA